MRKVLKNTILAILLLLTAAAFCGCSDNWDSPYESLQKEGYDISVRFDANGGMFAGLQDVYVVDVYNTENGVLNADGTVGFYLLDPSDPVRSEGAFSVSRNGYFLAGWYTERSLRVDENGQPLDEYGVLCSQSGRAQGYSYSGLWDFEEDLLTVDPSQDHTAGEDYVTLYAAWVPYINYEIYAPTSTPVSNYALLGTVQAIDLEIPEWSSRTGKLDMKKFPTLDGCTFDEAFLDPQCTQPLTETIYGAQQYVDYETGTLSAESVAIYTTWLDGTWFKIYTAEQLYSNARLDGNYMICADLDFSGSVWSPAWVKGKFTGKIYGNGHTISNITATQADNSSVLGGLFGSLESGAEIKDLVLENVTVTVSAGSRLQGASFGLLAGSVSEEAVFSNVSVSGNLYISENCYPQSDYTIGLLCGSGVCTGVTYDIHCSAAEDNTDAITVTVHDDGSVSVTFNP